MNSEIYLVMAIIFLATMIASMAFRDPHDQGIQNPKGYRPPPLRRRVLEGITLILGSAVEAVAILIGLGIVAGIPFGLTVWVLDSAGVI